MIAAAAAVAILLTTQQTSFLKPEEIREKTTIRALRHHARALEFFSNTPNNDPVSMGVYKVSRQIA